jgi:predicted small secreted protein
MIKKLLLATCLIITSSLLNASDSAGKNDDILSGIKQIPEEQMQSITGSYVTFTIIFPISGKETIVYQDGHELDSGSVLINGDSGETLYEQIIIWHP